VSTAAEAVGCLCPRCGLPPEERPDRKRARKRTAVFCGRPRCAQKAWRDRKQAAKVAALQTAKPSKIGMGRRQTNGRLAAEQRLRTGPLSTEERETLRRLIDQKARERARAALPGHRQLDRELEKRVAA